MKSNQICVLKNLFPILMMAILTSCGGDDITSSVTPATDSSIDTSKKIVITFSQSMDKATLVLSGNMAEDSDGGVWSKTKTNNDTLTISPDKFWDSGQAGTLNVKVNETTIELSYMVLIAIKNFQRADVVFGQPNFTGHNFGAASAEALWYPYGNPGFYKGKLLVPDYSHHRVLILNSVPTTNGASANVVIGQPNFTTDTDSLGSQGMSGPAGIAVYKNKLFVADLNNNRVLIFNHFPTSNHAHADVVVGQNTFGQDISACAATRLDNPQSIVIADDKLIITDANHHRIMIWNKIPTSNGEPADLVLGQKSFTKCEQNDDNQDGTTDTNPSARTLNYPTGVWSDGKKLMVSDSMNNRVLIWNKFPTTNFENADVVIGQSNFTHHTENDDNQNNTAEGNPSARTLYQPTNGLQSNGTQLFVSDFGNSRILIWNKIPTSNFAAADTVLGQYTFTSNISNDDDHNGVADATPSDRTFANPAGLLIHGNQLITTEVSNHRVLIFNGN